jgi:hypothetical protein
MEINDTQRKKNDLVIGIERGDASALAENSVNRKYRLIRRYVTRGNSIYRERIFTNTYGVYPRGIERQPR